MRLDLGEVLVVKVSRSRLGCSSCGAADVTFVGIGSLKKDHSASLVTNREVLSTSGELDRGQHVRVGNLLYVLLS